MIPTLRHSSSVQQLNAWCVFVVWLFMVSAAIGVFVFGFRDWFFEKTPLNLLILFGALSVIQHVAYPQQRLRYWFVVCIIYVLAMLTEWHGVRYGILFGSYQYLDYLGPKIVGVPWMIGINWVLLIVSTAGVAQYCSSVKWIQVVLGALFMLWLDIFIEPNAPLLHFWKFEHGMPPIENYISWFIVSFVFHFFYQKMQLKSHIGISFHIYISQFLLFILLYAFNI
jgi:Predicted membrane protein